MRGPAIVGNHSRPRPRVVVPYAVMLALVVSILGGRATRAQAPSSLRIIQSDPAPAAEDPGSEEIWISSDEPGVTTTVPTEFSRGEATPPLASRDEPSVKRVLRVVGEQRPAQVPGLAVAASDQPAEKDLTLASQPEVKLRIPNLASFPEAPRFQASLSRASALRLLVGGGPSQMSKAAESIDRVSSGDTFAQTQPAEAEQPVVIPTGALTIRNQAAEDDLTLFYTTSGPRKPASLVFAPPSNSPPNDAAGGPEAEAQTPSQAPAAPTDEPPTMARTEKPSSQRRTTATEQPSRQPTISRRDAPTVQPPIASGDQPHAPASLARIDGKQGPSKTTPPSEEFSLIPQRRKTLRTKIDVVRVAAADPSVCEVEQLGPRAISLVGKGQGSTQVTFWFRDDRHRPVTCLVRVMANEEIRQVVFRVKIAELKGSAGFDRDLKSPQHGSLLEALVRAEAGARPVILDGLDTDQIESRLSRLEQQDRLRVVSQPILMTSSGQPATIATGDGTTETTIGIADSGSSKAADLNAALTLLPVVTDNDDIQLHVVAEFSPVVSDPGIAPAMDATARETTTQVRLHPGQTLVIGSPLHELKEEKSRGLVPILSQVIGYTEQEPEQAKLVVLITPELIPQSERPASLASHQRLQPGKPALRR